MKFHTITYNTAEEFAYLTFKGWINTSTIDRNIDEIIGFLKTHTCHKLLIDLQTIRSGVATVETYLLPMLAVGILEGDELDSIYLQAALVHPKVNEPQKGFNQSSDTIEYYMAKYFVSVVEAERWLSEPLSRPLDLN